MTAAIMAGGVLVAALLASDDIQVAPQPPSAEEIELKTLREDIAWGIDPVEKTSVDAVDRRLRIDEFFVLNRSTVERAAELAEGERRRRAANWVPPARPEPVDLVPEDAQIRAIQARVTASINDAFAEAGNDPELRRRLVDRTKEASVPDVEAIAELRRRSEEARRSARDLLDPGRPPLEPVFASLEERELYFSRQDLADKRTAALDGITDPLARRAAVDRFELQHAQQTALQTALERLVYEQRSATPPAPAVEPTPNPQ